MYEPDENESSSWCATDCILKVCDAHITLLETHEGKIWYGGSRKKRKVKDGKVVSILLGRASEADEERRAVNARRVQRRRNTMIRDLMNCNEGDLDVFDTLTGTGDYRDIEKANNDKKNYFSRLERFVRTGCLFRKKVQGFCPIPGFKLKVLGVIEFQDGKRNSDGKGTGNIHFHHFQNTPYLPQVFVVHARLKDENTLEWGERYLAYRKGVGLYWSRVVGSDTPWFNSEKEVLHFIRKKRKNFPGLYFNAEPKKVCVNALLWGRGHTKIKKLKDLRSQGKLSNAGEYLCQYVGEDAVDERLRNHRGWYKKGELDKPDIYRESGVIEQMIYLLDLWNCFTHQYEFVAEYLGACTKYFFNLWVKEFPWIRKFYELREYGQNMTRADWLSCGVGQIGYQPLLL